MSDDGAIWTPGCGLIATFDQWFDHYEQVALASNAQGEERMHYAYIQRGDSHLDMGALDAKDLLMTKAMLWRLMREAKNPQTVVLSVELWASLLDPNNPRHVKIKQRLDTGRLQVKDLPAGMRYDKLVIAGQGIEGRKKVRAYRINPPTTPDGLRTHTEMPIERELVAMLFPLFPPKLPEPGLDPPTTSWGGRTIRIG